MEFTSSVSPKGQITIPLPIRRQIGIKTKDKITIKMEDGTVTLSPMTSRLAASYQAVPALKKPLSDKEMVEIATGEQTDRAAKEGL